jgi:hypothetical protein
MEKIPVETKSTTIEVSMKAYEQLHSVQEALKKILRRRQVSFDQVIRVMFACTRLDDTLIEMQLENGK